MRFRVQSVDRKTLETLRNLRRPIRSQVQQPAKESLALSWAKVVLGFAATFSVAAVGWYFTWTQNQFNKTAQEIEIARELNIGKLFGASEEEMALSLMSSFSDDFLYKRIVSSMSVDKRQAVLSKAFVNAIVMRDYRTLDRLIDILPKSELQSLPENNYTLSFVAGRGNPELLRYFLNSGFLTAYDQGDALSSAAGVDFSEGIRLLIRFGANVNERDRAGSTALHVAAQRGNATIANQLLEHGAKPDLTDKDGKTPLFVAMGSQIFQKSFDRLPVIEALTEHGADIDRLWSPSAGDGGVSLLDLAVQENDISVFRYLIDRGAKQIANSLDARESEGEPIAFDVAHWGRTEMLQILIAKGLDPNLRDRQYGYTLLNQTSVGHYPQLVEALLEAGANPNLANSDGDVPIVTWLEHQVLSGLGGAEEYRFARENERNVVASVQAAVRSGASINARGQYNNTALCNAARNQTGYVVDALIRLNADITLQCGVTTQTAIESAVYRCRSDSVALLLAKDPNLTYLTDGNLKLLSLAREQQDFYNRNPELSYANPRCDEIIQLLTGNLNAKEAAANLQKRYAQRISRSKPSP